MRYLTQDQSIPTKFCGGVAYQLGTGALFGGGGAPIRLQVVEPKS